MDKFVEKHKDIIVGTLSCFDRIIFKGYLPISFEESLTALFCKNHWLIKDFRKIAPKYSGIIARHAQSIAEKHGRPFINAKYTTEKEEQARAMAEKDHITSGLVCVMRTIETCNSFKIVCGKKRPRLKRAIRKCRFFYYYFLLC